MVTEQIAATGSRGTGLLEGQDRSQRRPFRTHPEWGLVPAFERTGDLASPPDRAVLPESPAAEPWGGPTF